MVQNGQYPITKEKCAICGYNEHIGSLQVHHIDGNHQNNAIKNLVVWCSNCHMKYHHDNPIKGKKKKLREKREQQEEITQELQNTIENISYEMERFRKAHFVDCQKIIFYQKWLHDHIDNNTFREIQNKVNEIK